jgi:acyl-CoA dehydrogenase
MIFGQGAIRSHPYVYAEIEALQNSDVAAFDRVIWQHLGSTVRHKVRTVLLSLTRGGLVRSPVQGSTVRYYRKLAWASATFALFSDFAMMIFGGTLKRRETLTGRFADVLTWLYLGTATLRRFEAEGRRPEDLPLVDWAMQYTFAQLQQAFEGLFANLSPVLRPWAMLWRLNPIGTMPSDALGAKVANILQTTGAQRDRLTSGIYLPTHPDEALGRLEQAMQLTLQTEPFAKAIKAASLSGQILQGTPDQMTEAAVAAGIITAEQARLVREAAIARNAAIQVDSFAIEEVLQAASPSWNTEQIATQRWAKLTGS